MVLTVSLWFNPGESVQYAVLLAIFVVLGFAIAERPYTAATECIHPSDCRKIDLHNQLETDVMFSSLSVHHGHLVVAVFCEVRNHTDSAARIDRKQFSAVSSDGVPFEPIPFKVEKGLKVHAQPDLYEVPAHTEHDYVFIFRSVEKYSKKECREKLKKETYFFRQQKQYLDTLFKLKAADRRLQLHN